jgi:Mitochondrial ribosomal protein L37
VLTLPDKEYSPWLWTLLKPRETPTVITSVRGYQAGDVRGAPATPVEGANVATNATWLGDVGGEGGQ